MHCIIFFRNLTSGENIVRFHDLRNVNKTKREIVNIK